MHSSPCASLPNRTYLIITVLYGDASFFEWEAFLHGLPAGLGALQGGAVRPEPLQGAIRQPDRPVALQAGATGFTRHRYDTLADIENKPPESRM